MWAHFAENHMPDLWPQRWLRSWQENSLFSNSDISRMEKVNENLLMDRSSISPLLQLENRLRNKLLSAALNQYFPIVAQSHVGLTYLWKHFPPLSMIPSLGSCPTAWPTTGWILHDGLLLSAATCLLFTTKLDQHAFDYLIIDYCITGLLEWFIMWVLLLGCSFGKISNF